MTPRETALLVRYIKSVSPAQLIDDYTYETWHDIIGHLDLPAARAAVIAVKHSKAFVDPSDIIREVERAKRPPIGEDPDRHPSARPAKEVLAEAAARDYAIGPLTPPNEDYRQAKQLMIEKMSARDSEALSEAPKHPAVPIADRYAAYAIKCPWCGVQPNARCKNTVLDQPKNEPHPARVEAAKDRAKGRTA